MAEQILKMDPLFGRLPGFDESADRAFSRELRTAARALLEQAGDHRYADAGIWLKIGLLLLGTLLFYGLALAAGSAWSFGVLYVLMHLCAVLLAVNVSHDASHGALSPRPWVNALAMRLAALPMGNEPVFWKQRHVRYHHPYANIEHYDVDTEANAFLRQTPHQAWYPWFRFQHLYWPVIAALSLLYVSLVYDWSDRLGKTPLAKDRLLPGLRGWAVFVFSKLAHLGLFLVLPLVLQGPQLGYGAILLAWLCGQALASWVLLTLLLGTHWAETEFFELDAEARLDHSRDRHAFLTSCDWQPRPGFLGHLTGGLNHHLTHHLLPGYSHRHYPALADKVRDLAARHELDYRRLGYFELVASQQRFLKAMGRRPPAVQRSDKGFL
ncbi:fatty acid desaturase family protein [Comamonas composti]|uniref:fatty acid desaturase family protein n=1 Tax=Comamonas composti TaxID=408558 RepID=UPI00040144E3|nr:fatty acid desaturase [Comamonas composti]